MNTEANMDAMRWENEDYERFEKLAEEMGFDIEISELGIELCDEWGDTYFYNDWHDAWNVLREEEKDAIQAQIEYIDSKIG